MGGFRKTRVLLRRAGAILFALACIGAVSWATFVSYKERMADRYPNFDILHNPSTSYAVSIMSVDEVAGKVKADVQLRIAPHSLVELHELDGRKVVGPENGEFFVDNLDFGIEAVQTQDFGLELERMGVFYLALPDRPPKWYKPKVTTAPPPVSEAEFTLIGNSKLYPFDDYVVIGKVSSYIFASPNKKDYFYIESGPTSVYLRAPDFVMTTASDDELLTHEGWPKTPDASEFEKSAMERTREQRKKLFAVSLRRPFFLKVLSIFRER